MVPFEEGVDVEVGIVDCVVVAEGISGPRGPEGDMVYGLYQPSTTGDAEWAPDGRTILCFSEWGVRVWVFVSCVRLG